MKKSIGILILFLLANCSHDKNHWSHKDQSNWHKVSSICANGKMQSPINIENYKYDKNLLPLKFNFQNRKLTAHLSDHGIEVKYPEGSYINLAGERYYLKQFHFHTPAEHAIKSKNYPMVIHFVTKNDKNQLAVFAMMFKIGKENIHLNEIIKSTKNQKEILFHLRSFLPVEKSYYYYEGSLTTPPCSEEVKWHIFTQPVEAADWQLEKFSKIMGKNNRELQTLNNRIIVTNIN